MPELDPSQASALLAQILANHFAGATVDGDTVDLNLAGVRVRCRATPDAGERQWRTVSLFFWLTGGLWEGREVFASASGYGPSVHDAIVSGGCNWGCTAAPVLRGALTGTLEDTPLQVDLDGAPARLFVEAIDRSLVRSDEQLPEDFLAQTRAHLCGGAPTGPLFLAQRVVVAEVLPVLPARPTMLSVFVGEAHDRRIVEIKVDGVDWPLGAQAFDASATTLPGMAMLREVAMIVPDSLAPLSRITLERTLDGFARPLGERLRPAVDWRGWNAHGGLIDPPMSAGDLADLEAAIGTLPEDYRHFLRTVGEAGAGPGYGLLSPDHSEQVRLASGAFPYEETTEHPDAPLTGAVVLAHAGCAVVWFLVLNGAHRGEVWVDAQGSSGGVYPVARSFDAWYRAWLDNGVGAAGPWLQWNTDGCASGGAIRKQSAEHQGPAEEMLVGATIALKAGGGVTFRSGDPVDPCEGCLADLVRFGMSADDIGAGVAPIQAR